MIWWLCLLFWRVTFSMKPHFHTAPTRMVVWRPGCMAQLVGGSFPELKGCRLDSWSGQMPGLQVWSLTGEATGLFCSQADVSPSLPPSFFSLKSVTTTTTTTKTLCPDWCGSVRWESSVKVQSKRLPVQFLVRAHAWVAGSVPGWGTYDREPIDVSHISVSLLLFLPAFPLKIKTKQKQQQNRDFGLHGNGPSLLEWLSS